MKSPMIKSLLAICISSAFLSQPVLATPFTIKDGEMVTGRQTLTGNETGTIGIGATLQQPGNQTIRWSAAQEGTVSIDNRGQVLATNGARAIDTQGNTTSANYHIELYNREHALIDSDNDAFRLTFSSGILGSVHIDNAGTMRSNEGQVLDFAGMQQGELLLNNRGRMHSVQHDAIRTGNLTTVAINNSGTISSQGQGRRGIDINGDGGERFIDIHNSASGVIQAQNDAIRVNYDLTGGNLLLVNDGLIETTGLGDDSGQALDFNSVTGTAVHAIIRNNAGAIIQSADADAVRPGGHGKVFNAGLIRAGGAGVVEGAESTSADGIDFQQHDGQVFNLAGGRIEGARHGITGNGFIEVVNQADGTIIGWNGSGVNLDGNGRVLNYGVISGRYNPQLSEGDGDGIDIDFIGDIENYGWIEGIGAAGVKNGDPNRADGIAMGGGRIINHSGATIYSSDRGILIDDSDGGAAFGATLLVNAGTIDALNEGVQLRGDWDDTLINKGSIISRNQGVAIDMGGGNDRLELHAGSMIQGSILGGTGQNQLILTGDGHGFFGHIEQFQSWQVQQGIWQMAADLQINAGDILAIDSNAQLDVQGNALLDGELSLSLSNLAATSMLAIDGDLAFGADSWLTLDLSNWLPSLDDVWSLFSAQSVTGFDQHRVSFTGLSQLPQYQFITGWQNGYYQVGIRFNQQATVSEPASFGGLLAGLFALGALRRTQAKKRKHLQPCC
ncbi:autotransporter outer membrane beta-barrel domain-containing protein [Alkalimonas mucilaginosa]|uniref:PEP-CTERM protein-sorting domain-containing protein n=1 Tax=Alkalimonas mucilaginosa TaxID=3057676 RepID=A0ABU7JBP6_9GAMM|nr:hypothetical protein [Alkalimonas sp. MEB004]MEE2023111.1 hypothetical protein [Alkalimonas sp. MEB004]